MSACRRYPAPIGGADAGARAAGLRAPEAVPTEPIHGANLAERALAPAAARGRAMAPWPEQGGAPQRRAQARLCPGRSVGVAVGRAGARIVAAARAGVIVVVAAGCRALVVAADQVLGDATILRAVLLASASLAARFILLLLLALLVLAQVTHELLEKRRLQVELLVFLVHENLALHLLLRERCEGDLRLLVQARVCVAQGMQLHPVLARPGDLEAQLRLDDALLVADALVGEDARARVAFDEKDPPLLVLCNREEGSMCGPHRLVLAQVLPVQLDDECGHVADDDLILVFNEDLGVELHVAHVRAEGLDVRDLVGLHLGHALALLGVALHEVDKARHRVLPFRAMLQRLRIEVGDLQKLRTLHVERLDQAAAELDHRLRGEEPLAHASDLDHGLGDFHGVLQQLVQVGLQLRRQQVV
mmetsp:Transcript_115580/g.331799  ORF Transcript_115580/g.331799 Transcript_115580/m.331799 type:complete len:418 (+) Transcript_115580:16-1269(+)